MQKAFNHSILLVFAGLLLFNSGGSFILFKLKELSIEQKFEKALAAGKITTNTLVAINANNVKINSNNEILVNGKYFDIVSVAKTSQGLVYYCLPDEDETALYALMAKFEEDNDEGDDEDETLVPNHFSPHYFQSYATAVFFLPQVLINRGIQNTIVLPQNSSAPLSPPPKA